MSESLENCGCGAPACITGPTRQGKWRIYCSKCRHWEQGPSADAVTAAWNGRRQVVKDVAAKFSPRRGMDYTCRDCGGSGLLCDVVCPTCRQQTTRKRPRCAGTGDDTPPPVLP